jgi:hypothetical protein
MDKEKPAGPSAATKRQKFQFFREFGVNIVAAMLLVGLSIAIGTIGYHTYADMAWIDAFANASMIVSGMGPLDPLTDNPARIFAACFALYAGLALVATTGLLVAPLLHSFVERLHVRGG